MLPQIPLSPESLEDARNFPIIVAGGQVIPTFYPSLDDTLHGLLPPHYPAQDFQGGCSTNPRRCPS